MATVALKDVRKSYGDQEVIHGVDLDVRDGEFIVIVGPSGCGKSTLLRMVAGLERITKGQISIGGKVVNELEPRERNIAMVFQNYALYPHMSVFDNMAYGLKIAGLSREEIRARVGKAASMLRLEPYLDRKPKNLSGGQRQRVAMGRALVREPAVFLFDEPLSNLDAKLRVQMRLEIKTLQRDVGTTSLYVTHDQVEAMTLADRLVVMNEGVAEQIATPMEVYSAPATTFVAGFIGSPAMNLMAGEISGGAVALQAGSRIALRESVIPEDGRKVLFGLRPEHVKATAPSEADFSLTVAAVETLGADTLAHGRIAGETDFVARLPGGMPVAVGETIPLAIEPGAAHLFDASSGRRV
ncbi:sn-glycerol-3-phosphate import ATP-binding protein UgpC [Mesorhizobium australicum]|uniref:Carbohydrate ABC transporter ATP-binding protein, CUT1 family n=1 Tax=Mesorhizobium australicum TaxID=536018 RepID=A0A1X7PHE9_9HYPH|nr:sn-glycerol-3-phosphate import ATP-binding protein UgpC [Mesorhizobium australicum]SMH50882.1 carbohydrate ABC transporter ATP-binding protein, CUT1 family [Mesorhizobium australicum]